MAAAESWAVVPGHFQSLEYQTRYFEPMGAIKMFSQH